MLALTKLRKYMDLVLEIICILIFSLMVIVGTYQIVTRYVFSSPSTVSEELLTYAFTWLALFAAALVFGKRDHMRMSYFADKMKVSKALLSLIAEVLVIGFAALVLVYGGASITRLTATQVTASLGVPMSYVYSALPVSGVLIVIYGLLNIYDILQGGEDK
jgi:TRAP-type C4-dicarboxylate transport system permease small subunit